MNFGKFFLKKATSSKRTTERLTIKARLTAFHNLPKFISLIWKTSPRLAIANIFLRITQSLLPLAMLYIAKLMIDQVIMNSHRHDSELDTYLWHLVALEFGLTILSGILSWAISFVDSLLCDLVANYTSVKLMAHAATLDLNQFEDATFYDKLERARQQTAGRTVLLSQISTQVQDIVTMGFLSVGLISFNPSIILLLLIAVIPSFVSEYYFNGKNYALIRNQTEGRRELDYLRYLGASDVTAKEVKVFDLSSYLIDRFRKISKQIYLDNLQFTLKRTIGGTILTILGSTCYYLAYVFIIRAVLNGTLSIGGLTFLAGSFRQVRNLLQTVVSRFSSISLAAIYLEDFFGFFEIKPRIITSDNSRPFPNPIQEGFTFENVSFKYPTSSHWAIRNLNFTLHAGERLALVGENGAGKSTLVKLLARLYDPTEGCIVLDGHDLREYDLAELRMQMGIIFQDFLHYQMTSSQNIAVGNIKEKDNHDRIINSAKKSFVNKIIEGFPNKYEQMLGRQFSLGIELSGGEWQKIALARAYMRDAQIFILDEPTAALDARAEYEVFQRFADIMKGKCAVLISHRFSTVRMANRILVLENGELIEIGNHKELLIKDGRYAELFQLQAMGYK